MAEVTAKLEASQWKKYFKFLSDFSNDSTTLKQIAGLASADVFVDIMDHFKKEEGHDGRWKEWSDMYAKQMNKIGKGNNNILQDTGILRQSVQPNKWRLGKGSIFWFNNAHTKKGFPYAAHHDETAKKTRSFMWLSDQAMEKISVKTLALAVEGK